MVRAYVNLPDTLKGITLMVMAMFCFAAMSVTIRYLSAEVDTFQLVFLRNVLALCLLLPWLLHVGRMHLRTDRLGVHFIRAIVGIIGMQLWFYCLSVIPVNVATAVTFMTPIFVTLGAIVWFGERVGLQRWLAIMTGFLGVLLVLRPGTDMFDPWTLLALLASVFHAAAGLMVKNLSRTESATSIIFYMTIFMIPLSLPTALPVWQTLSPPQWGWMALIAVTSTGAHIFLVNAYRKAEMQVIMPFDFTRLLFTAVIAWFWFGEALDLWTFTGAGVIVASTVYVAHREARAARLSREKRALMQEAEVV